MKLAYVAGPYRADTAWKVEQNIRRAEAVGHQLVERGYYPVIPHSNTRGYFADAACAEFWLDATLELLKRCDLIVMVDGWAHSSGAVREHNFAVAWKIPVYLSAYEVPMEMDVYKRYNKG